MVKDEFLYKTFNFKDFTMKDTKFCVCRCMCLCMCMEVCIDNKLVRQIGPLNKYF